jgi:uncharacterized protein (TIGR02996 family)
MSQATLALRLRILPLLTLTLAGLAGCGPQNSRPQVDQGAPTESSAPAARPDPTPTMKAESPPRQYDPIVTAIRQKPWDATAVLALADWFEKDDKPRAKLVHLQLELSPLMYDNPRFRPLQKEIGDLISEHRERWMKRLGSLAGRAKVEFEVGLIDSIGLDDAKDGDLAEIEKIPEVRVLRLQSPRLSAAGYQRLARLPNLDSLTIEGNTSLPKEGLAQLDKLPPWAVVHIYTTDEDRAAARAMNARRASKFKDLSANEKHSAGVRFLGAIGDGRPIYGKPHTGAQLSQAGVDDTHMPFVAAVSELEGVYISESDVTTKGIAQLASLKELKSLGLYQTKVTSIAALAGLTKLETLGIFPEFDIKMGDTGLEGVQNFINLQDLYLNDNSISDATVKRLTSLTKMKKLDLTLGDIKDENCIAAFSGMTDLKSLALHGGNISDGALRHLAGLKKMNSLSIKVSRGSGAGFQHLSGLDSLQYLYVHGKGVTDESMQKLHGLKKLELIMAQGSAVTANGAKKLAASLPHVTIILDESVVKTPRESYTFIRRKLNGKVSILVPKDWISNGRESEDSIYALEDGWQKVGSWSGRVVGPAEIRLYADEGSKSAKEAMMASVNNNAHLHPKVLKNDVISIEGSKDVASCIYRNDHGEYMVCAAKVGEQFIVLDCTAPPARFSDFAKLFSYVAKSIRISDDVTKHAQESVEVRTDTLKSK